MNLAFLFSLTSVGRELDSDRLPNRGRGAIFSVLMTTLAALAMVGPKRNPWCAPRRSNILAHI